MCCKSLNIAGSKIHNKKVEKVLQNWVLKHGKKTRGVGLAALCSVTCVSWYSNHPCQQQVPYNFQITIAIFEYCVLIMRDYT